MVGIGGTTTNKDIDEDYEYGPWYKWGVIVLYLEMIIATAVTLFAMYMAFTGAGGLGGH